MESQKALDFIKNAHAAGKSVVISTYLKHTRYQPKHTDMFRLSNKGDLLVQRGRNWDCIATPRNILVRIAVQA